MILKNESTGVSLGAYHLPDRKKPQLAVAKDGYVKIYGAFKNDVDALEFMETLAEFCGAVKRENEDEQN